MLLIVCIKSEYFPQNKSKEKKNWDKIINCSIILIFTRVSFFFDVLFYFIYNMFSVNADEMFNTFI